MTRVTAKTKYFTNYCVSLDVFHKSDIMGDISNMDDKRNNFKVGFLWILFQCIQPTVSVAILEIFLYSSYFHVLYLLKYLNSFQMSHSSV